MKSQSSQTTTHRGREGMMVAALAGLAVGLLMQLPSAWSAGRQETVTAGAGSSDVPLAVAAQLGRESYGLFLIDQASSTIVAYQWLPDTRKLQMISARNCVFDRQLSQYNTEPLPQGVQGVLGGQRPDSPTTRP